MAKRKSEAEERAIILEQPQKRPYAVELVAHLKSLADFGNLSEISILMSTGQVLVVGESAPEPWEGGVRRRLRLEGFRTASDAEEAGRLLAQALFLQAVALKFPLKLVYNTPEPPAVFDRSRPPDLSGRPSLQLVSPPRKIIDGLADALSAEEVSDPALLLSMELFCAAPFQSSLTSTFLAMVSALEPLAKANRLDDASVALVASFIAELESAEDIPRPTKGSLKGRLELLKQESIGQAIRRLVNKSFPNEPDTAQFVKHAYELRSQLVHSGKLDDPDINLNAETIKLADLMRRLYGLHLNQANPAVGG